jgi:hypothetical protein
MGHTGGQGIDGINSRLACTGIHGPARAYTALREHKNARNPSGLRAFLLVT